MHSATFVRRFVSGHDEFPAFHAAYLVLTFLAAALFNLGFFACLIVGHMALDVIKCRESHRFSWGKTLRGMLRESIVDIAFLSVGLVFAVYLHHAAGIIAVSGFLRSEATVLHAIGKIVPKLKVLTHVAAVITHPSDHLRLTAPVALRALWSPLEITSLLVLLFSAAMLFAAPIVLARPEAIAQILVEELVPWRM